MLELGFHSKGSGAAEGFLGGDDIISVVRTPKEELRKRVEQDPFKAKCNNLGQDWQTGLATCSIGSMN